MKFHLQSNRNENRHSFSAKKRKRKSPDNISVFFSFLYIQSPTQPYNVSPIPRPVLPFLQVVLVDGIPLSSCTVYRYLSGIFLDDISTREQFAFLVYCYGVKAIFHNLCTVLYWHLCGQQIAPIVKTLSTEADVHGAQKVLSNNGFRMANCFCSLSQNAMVCLAHCHQELQQKS